MIYETVFVLTAIYVLTFFALPRRRRFNGVSTIPTMSTFLPWFGFDNLMYFLRDPRNFVENGSKQFGPVFMFPLCGSRMAFVNYPATLSQIERQTKVIDDEREVERASAATTGIAHPKRMTKVLLDQLIPIIIKILSPASLASDSANEFYDRLVKEDLDALVPEGEDGVKLTLWDFVSGVIYRTSSVFLFGSTFPVESRLDLQHTLHNLTLLASPLGQWPICPGYRSRARILAALMKYLEPCWEDGAVVELLVPDAHQLVIDSINIMRKSGLSIRESAGCLIELLIGIHGNNWFVSHQLFGRLLLEPDYKALIEEEVQSTHDIAEMKYLDSALWEALRRPYRVTQVRRATEDVELSIGKERYFIEKDTWFFIKPFNHAPSIFPDPFAFKPGRFLDPNVPKPRPFGDGHRVCKGRDYAKWQMLKLAAQAFRKFDMAILEKNGLPVVDYETARRNFKPEGSATLVDQIKGKDDVRIHLKRKATYKA